MSPEVTTPPSAMIGTPSSRAAVAHSWIARHLWHAGPRHHPGGADAAGADADLDHVGARLDERLDALAGDDVAADDGEVGPALLDRAHGVDHTLGVAVGGVDHEHVDAGGLERLGAFGGVGHADRRGDPESAVAVERGVGILDPLRDVLDRDQSRQAAVVVDERELLDPVLVEDRDGGVELGADRGGDEGAGGHEVGDRLARTRRPCRTGCRGW